MSHPPNDRDPDANDDRPESPAMSQVSARDTAASVADREFFIRQAFERDPVNGYELLFRRYYGVLCSHAVRYVYTREVAEDLVSDIFYSFWEKASYKRVTVSFRAYLFEAVRHKCFNYLKWEFSRENNEELPGHDLESPALQPHDIMEFDELCMRIEKTMDSLPPQCKKVFLMHRFEGKSYPEIAGCLNVSQKAVEAHISKALAIFRKIFLISI